MMQLHHTLYITEPDVTLDFEKQALRITHADGHSDHIPLHPLENIVSFSRGEASSSLLTACAQRGIGVSFLTRSGRLRYQIAGPVRGNVLLRKQQYLLSEGEKERLSLAASMIRGKIENAAWILARFRHNHPDLENEERESAERFLKDCADSLTDNQTDNQLRGIEGSAAKAYYRVFDSMLLTEDTMLHFYGRNRRPPKDPCNALLSFTYTLLATDCIQALESAGLDPYVGFFHGDRPGKPSLALDIMDELRPLLAERLVLRLINLNMMTSDMFEGKEDEGVYLNQDGRKIVLQEWNRMKRKEVFVPEFAKNIPQGLFPHFQAQQLARYLRKERSSYKPIRGR